MDRAEKIKRMQETVDRYPNVALNPRPATPAPAAEAAGSESVWDTMKRIKSNVVDKPLENLRMEQNVQARKWKRYKDELGAILNQ